MLGLVKQGEGTLLALLAPDSYCEVLQTRVDIFIEVHRDPGAVSREIE